MVFFADRFVDPACREFEVSHRCHDETVTRMGHGASVIMSRPSGGHSGLELRGNNEGGLPAFLLLYLLCADEGKLYAKLRRNILSARGARESVGGGSVEKVKFDAEISEKKIGRAMWIRLTLGEIGRAHV